ncbi:hypothetical protein CcaCcLH18_00346 [Colletotrichum camelliae]|nr:hypothetical protein CcaCcLH18_00346 [Colletotrichum camelliae]
MVQHIRESLTSGVVFVDNSDHVEKGVRLYGWARNMREAIAETRIGSSASGNTSSAIGQHLDDMDGVIADEHAQLLSTLICIWENMTRIEDDIETSKAIIGQARHGHVITKIFGCLKNGAFEPAACLERLELLPSEMFGNETSRTAPSFEKDETSDYQTVGTPQEEATFEMEQSRPEVASDEPQGIKGEASNDLASGDSSGHVIRIVPKFELWDGASIEQKPTTPGDLQPSSDEETIDDSYANASSLSPSSTMEIDSMYEEFDNPATLRQMKREIVNSIMATFVKDLDTYLGERTCSNDAEDLDDQDGEGDETPSRKKARGEKVQALRYACPYFKWNPRKYNKRPYSGPGWLPVRHVNAELGQHARAHPPCDVRTPVQIDEFGAEQEERIRTRLSRRPDERRTEQQRWEDDYRILFDVSDDSIPTPWYDFDIAILQREETFNEYLSREIMPMMRREIEQQVEMYMSDVEPHVMGRLQEIIQRVRPPLWEKFQSDRAEAVQLHGEEVMGVQQSLVNLQAQGFLSTGGPGSDSQPTTSDDATLPLDEAQSYEGILLQNPGGSRGSQEHCETTFIDQESWELLSDGFFDGFNYGPADDFNPSGNF